MKNKEVKDFLIERVKEEFAKNGNPYEALRGENWEIKEWKLLPKRRVI